MNQSTINSIFDSTLSKVKKIAPVLLTIDTRDIVRGAHEDDDNLCANLVVDDDVCEFIEDSESLEQVVERVNISPTSVKFLSLYGAQITKLSDEHDVYWLEHIDAKKHQLILLDVRGSSLMPSRDNWQAFERFLKVHENCFLLTTYTALSGFEGRKFLRELAVRRQFDILLRIIWIFHDCLQLSYFRSFPEDESMQLASAMFKAHLIVGAQLKKLASEGLLR